MSISEARRQLNLAEGSATIESVLLHGFSAIVEAISENKPYDAGSLNSIRVSFTDLRAIILDAQRAGLEDMGLEDLLRTIQAQRKKSTLDT